MERVRTIKKKVSKKRRAKKRVAKRSKSKRILGIAESAENSAAALREKLSEIEGTIDELKLEIDDVDSIGWGLEQIASEPDQPTRGVPREDVLVLLKEMLNLDEDGNVIIDDGEYVPLERPRIPWSQLQKLAFDLHARVMGDD